MNNFKEWLSDYLRYFMLGLAVLLVIGLALIGIRVYQGRHGDDGGNVIEILSEKETQGGEKGESTETERNTEPEKITETEKNTEPEKTTEKNAEPEKTAEQQTDTGKGTDTKEAGQVSAQTGAAGAEGNQTGVPEQGMASKGEGQTLTEPEEDSKETVTEAQTQPPTEKQTETEPPTEPEYVPVYKTLQGACYIRSGPGYEYEIIGEYSAGTVVEFLEDAGGWYKVQIDGMVGYMGARFF